MIGAVVENVIGGYLHPRASVRRILEARHGLDAVALMVALAFLLRTIFIIVVPDARPDVPGSLLGWYLFELATFLILFAILWVVVFSVGRYFGGTGTSRETGISLAWYLLVTSLVDLLMLTALVPMMEAGEAIAASPSDPIDIPGWAVIISVVSMAVSTWLLASFIAELHRFARTWNVLMAMVGFAVALGFVAAFIMQIT